MSKVPHLLKLTTSFLGRSSKNFRPPCVQCFTRVLTACARSYSSTAQNTAIKRLIPWNRRGNLVTMKLDSSEFMAQFESLMTTELKTLVEMFRTHDYELRIAGGAVRDLVMGKQPHDIDLATTATPDEMKAMFDAEHVRMINNRGEKHGTVTARINNKENFEVTTLRIDIATDGRHADVEFTKDWQLDANRRDLTINAMFLDFNGQLYDYFNGREDVENRFVRFVGNPVERIKEDYLRILRYFRFYGRIAPNDHCHDASNLQAIRENAEGLSAISGERLWVELKQIVAGNYADSIMATMAELDVSRYLGFTCDPDVSEFRSVWNRCKHLAPLPMTMMSALLKSEDEVMALNQRLKMSNDEVKLALFIVAHRAENSGADTFSYCRDLFIDSVGQEPKVKDRICELLKYKGDESAYSEFCSWTPPKFPITGHDLVMANVPKGPVFAKTLNELRQRWKVSELTMSKSDLLALLPEIIKQVS